MCSDLQHLPWMHAQNYLAIPDEFSVTGYNDSIMAVSCEPELTSVDNKLKLLCQTTVQHMIALLEKQEEVEQQILEKNTGVLLIHELPDTVKKKETEAQAYAAVWDLMAKLEKNLPMAFVFYGQDTLMENNKTYDEIGIFLPNSHFLKNLERHVAKAEAILYG